MEEFPRFLHLPLEIQDRVWELSVPVAAPIAYPVRLNFRGTMGSPYRDPRLTAEDDVDPSGVRVELLGPPGVDRADTRAALARLLVTCRRASATALRVYASLRPADLFPLWRPAQPGEESLVPRPLRTGYGAPVVPLHIDRARDLVVFQPGWQEACERFAGQPLEQLRWPAPSLHNLGLRWDGPRGPRDQPFCTLFAINGLLGMWLERRAVYVVVHPEDLAAAEGPWRPASERIWPAPPGSNAEELRLEDFLEAYRDDVPAAGGVAADRDDAVVGPVSFRGIMPFRGTGTRDRYQEYYEVSAEQVARSGGLEEVVELLETARVMCRPDEDDENARGVRCRVMSWRNL